MKNHRSHVRIAARTALLTVAAILVAGSVSCNPGDDTLDPARITANLPTASFNASASPDCSAGPTDMLSMQEAATAGSGVQIDLVLTDCDQSLTVSGVSFEITYNPNVVTLIGCSPGTLFPQTDLAPGLPICDSLPGGGGVLGTVALAQPLGVTVPAGGTATVVRLTFNLIQKGTMAPANFLASGLDDLSSSSVFLVSPSTAQTIVYTLGAGGYVGGTSLAN